MREEGKLEDLYGWVRNITGYFLFLAVMDNLIPGDKYGKYMRLFAGMVMILLVVQPLTAGLRLEERIAHFYETAVFQYQAEDLKKEILGIEQKKMRQMFDQYEHAAAEDIRKIAEDMDFAVEECMVEIGKEKGSEQFGMVIRVRMKINPISQSTDNPSADREKYGEEAAGKGNETEKTEGITKGETADISVRIDRIEVGDISKPTAPDGLQYGKKEGKGPHRNDPEVGKLRRKIMSYYDLEEDYVEIQVVEDREGKR